MGFLQERGVYEAFLAALLMRGAVLFLLFFPVRQRSASTLQTFLCLLVALGWPSRVLFKKKGTWPPF